MTKSERPIGDSSIVNSWVIQAWSLVILSSFWFGHWSFRPGHFHSNWIIKHALIRIKRPQPRMAVEYRVELEVYNGPLDLLLYLIKRDELDIYDIPIARITDTYMQYVSMLKEMSDGGLDINVAGDFLVMAATLMEIKSAMLLPKAPVDGAEGSSAAAELADPRYELVQKLLEYKRFKDDAMALELQQHQHENRFPRFPAKLEATPTSRRRSIWMRCRSGICSPPSTG